MKRAGEPLEQSIQLFNNLYLPKELYPKIFSHLKDPRVSTVCNIWYELNNSPETYALILLEYQQSQPLNYFNSLNFSAIEPLDSKEKVKQIFYKIKKICMVEKDFSCSKIIERDELKKEIEAVRKVHSPLDLSPTMQIIENFAFLDFSLCAKISNFNNLLTDELKNELNKPIDLKSKASILRNYLIEKDLSAITKIKYGRCADNILILPPEIGLFTNVTKLVFAGMLLSPNIGLLTNLESLHFYTVKAGQTNFPESLIQLPKLQNLLFDLQKGQKLCSAIGQLTSLTYLDITGMHDFTDPSTALDQLTNLTNLRITYTDLTTLPTSIGTLTNLTNLDISDNKLVELPTTLVNLNLTSLCYSGNNFKFMPRFTSKLKLIT